MDFTGQVVIVTGAAGNVGGAIARELAERGAKLALVDMAQDALAALAGDVAGDTLALSGIDLRKQADTERVAAETLARYGRIDALANTVGTFRMGRIDGEAAGHWQMLMDLNALSALLLMRAVAPAMAKARYGRIVHVAAGAALRSGAEMAAYSASKAALVRVAEAASEEFRRDGVTVNCIAPSTVDTPQNRAAMPEADTSDWLAPEQIAKAVAALISRDAGAITGALVPLARVG